MKKKAIGFLFVLMITIPLYAQEKSISLGDADLKLGMTLEQVVKALNNYDLPFTDLDRGNSFVVVYAKGKSEDAFRNIIGAIQFTGGKLTYASADRDKYNNSEAVSLAKRLFSLLSVASEDGKKIAIAGVSTKYDVSTNWTFDFVAIRVGTKEIVIRISNHNFVSIEEQLGSMRPK